MKILYIHGFNGSPEGPKKEMLRHNFKKSEIIAPQHDSRAENVFRLLNEIAENLDTLDDVILGSSLGGFWANYFSLKFGVGAVLVNPVVQPSRSLAQLDYPYAPEYEAFEKQISSTAVSRRIALLAEDDEVLPYREAFDYFGTRCGVKLLPTGGHRMNDPRSLELIRASLESVIHYSYVTQLDE